MSFGRKRESIRNNESVKLTKDSYSKARNFLGFVKPYATIYFIGFLFLLLSSVASASLPIFLGQILGAESSEFQSEWHFANTDNIYGVLSILAILLPLQAIFSFFRIITFHHVTHNSIKDIREKAFEILVKSPMAYFDSSKTGETISRISNDTEQIQETLTTTVAEFLRQIIIVIFGLVYIFIISPKLVLIMLAVIPIVAITAMLFGKFIKRISRSAQDETAKSNSIIEEALVGIKSLKAYSNEFLELTKYSSAVTNIKSLNMKVALWRGMFVAFIVTILIGAIIFIIWQGIEMVHSGGIEKKEFFQFILFTVMLGTSIGSIPDLFAKIQKSIGATESLINIIQQETEKIDVSKPVPSHKFLNGEIQFKNLKFSYPSRKDIKILNNLNLKIESGEQIALVGSSGSGKSTIANLILQFYKLDGGEIQFDGKNAEEYPVNELRSQMAFVPQEVILLGGTIEENIRYGKPGASYQEVSDAAEKANALDFINEFPKKFETIVGDRGIQLSGGQRQRIAIARAILRDPAILILDEATSALDSESESAVQDALNKLMKGRTSVIIAHRLSTIKNANSIVVMNKGEIAEQGTHDELVTIENGVYKRLSQLQFS